MANDNNKIQAATDDSQIVLYQPDESIRLEVKLDQDTFNFYPLFCCIFSNYCIFNLIYNFFLNRDIFLNFFLNFFFKSYFFFISNNFLFFHNVFRINLNWFCCSYRNFCITLDITCIRLCFNLTRFYQILNIR